MFPALDNKINLRLVGTRQFGSGVVLLRYQLTGMNPNDELSIRHEPTLV